MVYEGILEPRVVTQGGGDFQPQERNEYLSLHSSKILVNTLVQRYPSPSSIED
jgi:hypothetical protein